MAVQKERGFCLLLGSFVQAFLPGVMKVQGRLRRTVEALGHAGLVSAVEGSKVTG